MINAMICLIYLLFGYALGGLTVVILWSRFKKIACPYANVIEPKLKEEVSLTEDDIHPPTPPIRPEE